MSTKTTSIRLDEDLKNESSKLAKKLWLSLWTVIAIYLRKFVHDRAITLSEEELDWKTVVDFWEEGISARDLLDSYENTYGQKMA